MAVKARMFVNHVVKQAVPGMRVQLQAVSRGPENREWAAATPHGTIEMTILNEAAAKWFEAHIGKDVMVSFDGSGDDTVRPSPYQP